ncbi:unnamed protein product [Gadus morhua 'NCC']
MPDWVGNGIHLSSQSQNFTVDGGIIPRAAKEEARADTNACIDGNPIIVVMAAHLALPRRPDAPPDDSINGQSLRHALRLIPWRYGPTATNTRHPIV